MINTFKKIISNFTNKPIDAGYHLSIDGIKINKDLAEKPFEYPVSDYSAKYKLKNNIGVFELVSISKSSTKPDVYYDLKYTVTGETIRVTKKMFDLLFVKYRN